MVNNLVRMLPQLPSESASSAVWATLLVLVVAGIALWIIGTKLSHYLITLALVSAGAWGGLVLPRLMGWSIQPAVTCIGGALVAGVAGYLLHRLWVAAALGLILAAWVAVAAWGWYDGGQDWRWPQITAQTAPSDYLSELQNNIPKDLARVLPYLCGLALLSGLIGGFIWHRLASALLYSLVGVSLLALAAAGAMRFDPEGLGRRIPREGWTQAAALGVLVIIGTAVQLLLHPRRKAKAAPQEPSES